MRYRAYPPPLCWVLEVMMPSLFALLMRFWLHVRLASFVSPPLLVDPLR